MILFLSFLTGFSDSVSLKQCYDIAYTNHPEQKQKAYYRSVSELKTENLGINYLPKISLNGQVSYQSDVTKITIDNPFFNVPDPPKDRYQLTLDVRQLLYDGGSTGSQEEIELKQQYIENQKLEVSLFSLKQKINDLYFSVLLLQEKKRVNETAYNDIKARISELESKVRNEVITASSLYALQAQLLQLEQDISAIDADRTASLRMLSELLGEPLPDDAVLSLPSDYGDDFDITVGGRPEYKLFELQQNQMNSYSNLVSSRIIPKFSLFGQAGYGKPGLNMLEDKFRPFYMVGLNMNWNFINWGYDRNEKQIYEVNKNIIQSQRETLDKNLKVTLEKYKSDIQKYSSLLEKDGEIIRLRERIVASSYSQMQNGTITSTTYLTEVNNRIQSEILYETHKIQLVQSKINFLTTKGSY